MDERRHQAARARKTPRRRQQNRLSRTSGATTANLKLFAAMPWAMFVRADQFEFNRELAKIGKPVDRGEWGMTPPTVNAEYDPQLNDINFPAGVLQPPAFDLSSDAAPNYGDTGGTIGHELTHGFDDEGRQFDAQGNLRDWWTPDDEKEFVKRASASPTSIPAYTIVDDIKINGKLTLGEDIADLGGLILAYMAWKEDTKSPNPCSRSTVSRPISASSWATARAGAARPAPKPCACGRP